MEPNPTSPKNCVTWLILEHTGLQVSLKWINRTAKDSTSAPNATTWKTYSKTTSPQTQTSPAQLHNVIMMSTKLKVGLNTTHWADVTLKLSDSRCWMTASSRTSRGQVHTTLPSLIWTTVVEKVAPNVIYCLVTCPPKQPELTHLTRGLACPEIKYQVQAIKTKSLEQPSLTKENIH